MGKGTNLQTLSEASTTFCPRVVSHLWVSKIPTRPSASRAAERGNVGERRDGEHEREGRGGGGGGGLRGERWRENVQIFSLK